MNGLQMKSSLKWGDHTVCVCWSDPNALCTVCRVQSSIASYKTISQVFLCSCLQQLHNSLQILGSWENSTTTGHSAPLQGKMMAHVDQNVVVVLCCCPPLLLRELQREVQDCTLPVPSLLPGEAHFFNQWNIDLTYIF